MKKNKRIYLSSPHMSDEGFEMSYVMEAMQSNWIAPRGENIDRFESEISNLIGVSSAAALTSGTAAIHLALKAAGVGRGDIVFCPSLTFSASANPIIYENAVPVFIDSDIKTWNMCPDALEKAFEKYKPKAVIVVHIYGLSADMDIILDICRRYKTQVIEDAAESLGTIYKEKYTGSMADFGVFSFNGNKIITSSGGGMLVSNNKERIDKARFWSTQSRDEAKHYQHSELGYNYRMSNIVAGIGRGQLSVLESRKQKKKMIFEYYKKAFSEIDDICMMPVNSWDDPNYWLTCITLKGRIKPIDIINTLEIENIECRRVWKPLHMQPYFTEFDYIGNTVSEDIFNSGVCLPSDTKLEINDLKRITDIIKELWN